MRTTRFLLLLVLPMLTLVGCSNDGTEPQTPGTNDAGAIKFEIGFAGQDTQTRVATAADFTSTFEDGDQIGIFAVESGQPLAASDNPIHNVPLTYDKAAGTWSGEAYWPTGGTKLDFHAYYPYDASATDPTAMAFTVKADQSDTTDGRSDYNLSDLLAARSSNGGAGWAEGAPVSLSFSHELAMVQLTIDAEADGIDFDKDVTVTLQGVKTANTLNLSVGPSMAVGDAGDVVMHLAATDGTKRLYRALIPMQTVAAGAKLFRIENGDQTLTSDALTAEMTLTASTAELFTLSGGGTTVTPVTIAPIEGVTAPVAEATPQTILPETSQYTGTIRWIRDDNSEVITSPFLAGKIYQARITLTAKDGYTFEGLSVFDMRDGFTVNGIVPFNVTPVSDTEIMVSVLFDNKRIIPAPLTGLTAPATGAAPDFSADDTEGYEVGMIGWWDVANDVLFSGSTFDAGKVYQARIYLDAKEGWQFAVDDFDEWEEYIEGFLPDGTTLDDRNYPGGTKTTTIFYKVRFPATAVSATPSIGTATQNKPVFTGTVTYGIPTANIPNGTEVTVEWCDAQGNTPADVFNISKPAIEVVTDNNIALNFTVYDGAAAGDHYFKVSGGGAVSAPIKLTVATTPLIAPAPLLIVKPVTGGEQPKPLLSNGTGYTAEITGWFDDGMNAVDGNFEAEKVYTARVRLTIAEGYSLEGFTADDAQGFKPDNAASIRVDGSIENPLYLQITYPETEAVLKTITPVSLQLGSCWPIGGRSPVGALSVTDSDYKEFTVDRYVAWYSYTDDPFTDKFIPGVWYRAVIRLRAKPGFVFGDGWSYFEEFMIPAQELSGLEATELLRVTGNSPTGTNDTEIEMHIMIKAFEMPN